MGFLFDRDRAWAEEKKMFAYLSVANGSNEPPKFIELGYTGASNDAVPFALVGKGITFDRLVSSVYLTSREIILKDETFLSC